MCVYLGIVSVLPHFNYILCPLIFLSFLLCFFFFFSSRRRHTRLQGDWSSDVCSSDLESFELIRSQLDHVDLFLSVSQYYAEFMPRYLGIPAERIRVVPLGINPEGFKIGRASCRERV